MPTFIIVECVGRRMCIRASRCVSPENGICDLSAAASITVTYILMYECVLRLRVIRFKARACLVSQHLVS